jgi:hypothetical protein
MSRRYGRNQKRAHRQRIVELEEAYTRERHLLAYLRNQLDGLRAEIEDAKRELGANFIAFRPQTVRDPGVQYGSFRMDYLADPRRCLDVDLSKLSLTSLVFHVLELNAVRERSAAAHDRLHINVALADGRVRYSITESALAAISDERLVRELTKSLAQQLTVELRRLYPRRK